MIVRFVTEVEGLLLAELSHSIPAMECPLDGYREGPHNKGPFIQGANKMNNRDEAKDGRRYSEIRLGSVFEQGSNLVS